MLLFILIFAQNIVSRHTFNCLNRFQWLSGRAFRFRSGRTWVRAPVASHTRAVKYGTSGYLAWCSALIRRALEIFSDQSLQNYHRFRLSNIVRKQSQSYQCLYSPEPQYGRLEVMQNTSSCLNILSRYITYI